jgi:Tfp pilus assembly protein PilN
MRAVNLLPRPDPRRRGGKPSVQTQLTIAAPFFVAAILGVGFMFSNSKLNSARSNLRTLQQQLAALPPPPAPGNGVDPALAAQHAQRVSALADALSRRIAWDRILRQISSVLPDDVWLTTLNVQSSAAAASTTAVASGTGSISIQGYTYSQPGVARFLSRLQVIPELTQIVLQSSGMTNIQGRDVVAFTIGAGLRVAGAGS